MGATVDDIHHRHGQHFGVRTTEVFVEWDAQLRGGSLGHGHRDAENGVRAEVLLRRCAVQREHGGVDGSLLGGTVAKKCGSEDGVHVFNGLEHALAEEACLVSIAELDGFMLAGGGTGRDGGPADRAAFEVDIDFDGGIAPGVDDLAAPDFNNGGIVHTV